jgi:hypothetical protein
MAPDHEERVSAIRGFPSKTSHTLSALSGGAFVILIVVAFLLGPNPPTYDDTPAKFVKYYTDHKSQMQLSVLLSSFSVFWLVWFFGFLRWLYEGAERATRGFVRAGPIAFAGGIAGAAVAAMAGAALTVTVETAGNVDPTVTRALQLLHDYGLTWAALLLSVFLLSSFFVIRVTQVLPQWLGILAIVGSVLGFFQAVLFLAPGQDDSLFGIVGLIWFFLFLVFIFASSIDLARRVETALLAG